MLGYQKHYLEICNGGCSSVCHPYIESAAISDIIDIHEFMQIISIGTSVNISKKNNI